jgi:integrase/recombinase XerD
MIALFWALGLRLSELLNIRKKHFKMIDQHNKTGLLTINGKGRKQRSLFVVERLFDAFCEYVKPLNADALLFSSPTKPQHIDGSTVIRRINKHLKTAGLGEFSASWNGRITPHMLRHSFATEMYHANVPLEDIRQMMGHESLRDTTIYIHVAEEKLNQALDLLTLKGNVYVV